MTVLQALVLGIVQGLAEFLPISSSAHLTLTPWLLGWQDPGLAFDVALHLGTLVALAWYFRKDWVALTRSGLRVLATRRMDTDDERRAMFIVLATIPAGIAGVLLGDYAETAFRAPPLIATTLLVVGVILWVADRRGATARGLADMRWQDALAVGLAQACSIVPGVSRSGSTISASRLLGFDRRAAATFSFLLSFPVTAAAAVLKVPEAVREGVSVPLVVGVVAAAVSSALAISMLLRYVSRHGYGIFAVYRMVAGLGVLALWYARR